MARPRKNPVPEAETTEEEVPFSDEPESDEEEIDADELLRQASALAAEAAAYAKSDKKKSRQLIRELEHLLASVPLAQVPELADSPALQRLVQMIAPSNLQPGQAYRPGTAAEMVKPWTMKDVEKFPKRMLVPMETIVITWQGLQWQLVAGQPQEVPDCFFDVYIDSVKRRRGGDQLIAWMMGKGPPPSDLNLITPEAAHVRAMTSLGEGRMGVGPIRDEDDNA